MKFDKIFLETYIIKYYNSSLITVAIFDKFIFDYIRSLYEPELVNSNTDFTVNNIKYYYAQNINDLRGRSINLFIVYNLAIDHEIRPLINVCKVVQGSGCLELKTNRKNNG